MENRGVLADTSIIIEHLRKREKKNTCLYRLAKSENLYISSISLFELYCGANTSQKIEDISIITENLTVVAFDGTSAKYAGIIYRDLKSKNKLIDIKDLLIASCAVANSLSIATLNKKDFERIDGLIILSNCSS